MITEEMIKEHHELCEKSKKTMLNAGQPPGKWDTEPNRIEGVYKGLPMLMLRNIHMLNWCGYVGVPKGHPYFGKPYDDVDVGAHGGLTYSGPCAHNICHKPKAGVPDDVWWIGFDCAHAGDIMPFDAMRIIPGAESLIRANRPQFSGWQESYRDIWYVRTQCQEIANQVLERTKLWNRLKIFLNQLKQKISKLPALLSRRPSNS
jgi:hypothetical protein